MFARLFQHLNDVYWKGSVEKLLSLEIVMQNITMALIAIKAKRQKHHVSCIHVIHEHV